MTVTAEEMQETLKDCGPGTVVFVSYLAGREPTPKAMLEAHRAVHDEGIPRRFAFGVLCDVWVTKKGEPVMRIFSDLRDTLYKDGTMIEGAYRTFNPQLGRLLSLEVVVPVPPTPTEAS